MRRALIFNQQLAFDFFFNASLGINFFFHFSSKFYIKINLISMDVYANASDFYCNCIERTYSKAFDILTWKHNLRRILANTKSSRVTTLVHHTGKRPLFCCLFCKILIFNLKYYCLWSPCFTYIQNFVQCWLVSFDSSDDQWHRQSGK